MKPFAEACERNKEPILAVLREVFANVHTVLEIGSGTGQHAVYFAGHLPHLRWQTSDLCANHAGIAAWIADSGLPNVLAPIDLDVGDDAWMAERVDAVFSANTAHILSWRQVQSMMAGVGRVLDAGGLFCLYGPFSYGGRHTADSNEAFDRLLRARDPESGIRDADALDALALSCGLRRIGDYAMPANNRILVWEKT